MIQKTINTPYAVRGAFVTASASLTNGTNTTLISGDSDYKLDLIRISLANSSDAATTVTLSDDGTTVMSIPIAASTAAVHNFDVPEPQSAIAGNWQVDLPDITGTTITVKALFIKR